MVPCMLSCFPVGFYLEGFFCNYSIGTILYSWRCFACTCVLSFFFLNESCSCKKENEKQINSITLKYEIRRMEIFSSQ